MRAAIEETVAAQVPTATNKGLALDCTFGNNIPKLVKGDGQRIQQILNCLLSNALKFTSEGSVRVKIAAIDAEKENINLRIAVADTGIGISEKNMDKLFIRFSQVDGSDTRKYGGSGLGLVISKQIAELMGGNISVQSKEGIGSTFIAEIPLKVVKAAEVEAAKNMEEKEDAAVFSINAHSKARILVAEDEPVNQQVIGKLLGMAGFSYDIAENGEKAIELFKQKEYDAALFDVQMPVMDGIAATQQIREIERVILLKVTDQHWMNHIDDMDQLRQGIGLQAYGQRDPVTEYRFQGYDMFEEMTESIREETVKALMHVRIEQKVEREQVAKETGTNKDDSANAPVQRKTEKVGRNDPCPCGSGKKYKYCCGK